MNIKENNQISLDLGLQLNISETINKSGKNYIQKYNNQ